MNNNYNMLKYFYDQDCNLLMIYDILENINDNINKKILHRSEMELSNNDYDISFYIILKKIYIGKCENILSTISQISFNDKYLEIIVIFLAKYKYPNEVINMINMYNLDVHIYDDIIVKLLTSDYYDNLEQFNHLINFMEIFGYDINYNNGILINNSICKDGKCFYVDNYDIFELLLRSGANPNLITHKNKIMLFVSENNKIIELLVQYGLKFKLDDTYIKKTNYLISLGFDLAEISSIYLEAISIIQEY